MRIAVTGHRPASLFGYNMANPQWNGLRHILHDILIEEHATQAISGMALGVDTCFAEAAIIAEVPFLAAVPFEGQERMWPAPSQTRYHQLLDQAEEVFVVGSGPYSPKLLLDRNIWMVDNCDKLIAVWNGTESGGTYHCKSYAEKVGREVIWVDPRELI